MRRPGVGSWFKLSILPSPRVRPNRLHSPLKRNFTTTITIILPAFNQYLELLYEYDGTNVVYVGPRTEDTQNHGSAIWYVDDFHEEML